MLLGHGVTCDLTLSGMASDFHPAGAEAGQKIRGLPEEPTVLCDYQALLIFPHRLPTRKGSTSDLSLAGD